MITSPINLFFFYLVLIILLVFIFSYQEKFFKKHKSQDNKSKAIIIEKAEELIMWLEILTVFSAIPVFIMYVWLFPNVYVINECNDYSKKVLIYPVIYNGIKLEYGIDNCYLINKSQSNLKVESKIYIPNDSDYYRIDSNNKNSKILELDYKYQQKIVNKNIYPNQTEKLFNAEIEYLFESAPLSVWSKVGQNVEYQLTCE